MATRPSAARLGLLGLAWLPCVLAACAGCSDVGAPCATADTYLDPWEHLARLPSDTFIEVLEVQARADGFVFFCSGVQGLSVVDGRQPERPVRVAGPLGSSLSHPDFPRCQHVSVTDRLAIATSRGDELQPTPFLAGYAWDHTGAEEVFAMSLPDRAVEGLVTDDGRLLVAAHQDGLMLFSLNGTDAPTLRAELGGFDNAWDVDMRGDLAVVADGAGGVKIVDVTSLDAPAVVGALELGAAAQSVVLDDARDLAYVAAGGAGAIVVDIADPSSPVERARLDTAGTAVQVSATTLGTRTLLIVADWQEALAVDVTDPDAPVPIAREAIEVSSGFPRVLGAAGAGDVAWIGEWTGLHALRLHPGRSAPDVRLLPTALELPAAAEGETTAAALVVENAGDELLRIDGAQQRFLAGAQGTFMLEPTDLQIPPGGRELIEVRFTAEHDQPSYVHAFLCTDDPDEPGARVTLVGNPDRHGVGDTIDPLTVPQVGGGTFDLEAQRGRAVLLAYFATF